MTLQTLDGILCHDGEIHRRYLRPDRNKDFEVFDRDLAEKSLNPGKELLPMTLEGCVVRLCDTIAYIGRDIEDAIRLRLIKRSDLPEDCRRILGDTNGTIVYTLVEDLVTNSLEQPYVCFSQEIGEALKRLKAFNYRSIYKCELFWKQTPKIKLIRIVSPLLKSLCST